MKKPIRYTLYSLGLIPILLIMAIGYLMIFLPNVGPAPDIQIEVTPERVAHGKYLANHVMLCMDCHAVRDFSRFAGPPKPETLGAGGYAFDQKMGLPGSFTSKNITSAALGDWTDGEIFRAITSGVSKDGTALFPIMPYTYYSQMDQEDVYAIIAYLRTLEPIESQIEPSKADFPVSFLINTMPVKANLQPKPSKTDIVDYGRYLVSIASCSDCHTRMVKGEFVGIPLAGGNEFPLPDGSISRAANITPHETGIGYWTKEMFVARFKAHANNPYDTYRVEPGQFQSYMPWSMYAGMTEEDLGAIYEYLRTIEPADHRVQTFTPAE